MLRFLRWLFVNGIIAKIINNPFLQIMCPALTGAYFLILDVWGNDWKIVSDYKSFHEALFSWFLLATLLSQFYKGIGALFLKSSQESYQSFLEEFIVTTSYIVDFKLNRFRSCAKSLRPQGNTFKAITKPDDQIEYIIEQSIKLLKDSFLLIEEQISVTVIRIHGKTKTCYYAFQSNKPWNRTKAKQIVDGKSAASYCLEKGEPVYFADKFLASTKHEYYLSERDNRTKAGSVYCYPVFVEIPAYEDKYVISVVTYGKRLSDPEDENASKIIKSILREICRRIELELTLYSIRAWQFNE